MRSLLCRVGGIGKVWVVSDNAPSVNALLAELGEELGQDRINWFDEQSFPFKWQDVDRVMHCGKKCGWYFQQLLKLYAGRALPGIRDYLVADADLVWYGRSIEMVAEMGSDGRPAAYYYNTAAQKHGAYFDHMARLTGGQVRRVDPQVSGVVHHMVFKRDVLEAFMKLCEAHAGGAVFWEALLRAVDPKAYNSVSEYELYFNYALQHHPGTIRLRHLTFANGPRPKLVYNGGDESKPSSAVWIPETHGFEKQMALDQKQGYAYVGYHSYAKRRYFDVPQSTIHLYCELGIGERNSEIKKRCS